MSDAYIREGNSFEHSVTNANNAVSANDVVVAGALAGVATESIGSGEKGTVAIVGVWYLKADNGNAMAVGANVAWDVSGKEVILSGNAEAGDVDNFGKVMVAKEAADEYVEVRLTPDAQTIHA